MNTTLPTEPEIASLAEELRSEDSTIYIKAALMTLCRRYVAHITTSEAYIAALEAQLAAAQKWVPPVGYESGTLSIGDKLYVEVRGWGGDEDAAWAHLSSIPPIDYAKTVIVSQGAPRREVE